MKTPKLTKKQEGFAQSVVEGLNDSDAYRKHYSTKKMKPETIWQRAHELRKHSKVAARIAQLQERAMKRHDVTVDTITIELEEARELALKTDSPAAMVSASLGKAKIHGLITDKHHHGAIGGGPLPTPQQNVTVITSENAAAAYAEMVKGG